MLQATRRNVRMVRYIKCPRCELNYIDADRQEYCDVCIAEMKGNKLEFADLDDEELEEELEAEATELCPVCGVNLMRAGETMCDACKQKEEYEEEPEVDPEQDEEWKNYLSDDSETEDLTLDNNEIDEELEEGFGDEEEEDDEYNSSEDDELEDDFKDDYSDLDDLDDEDDEDDDDDDLDDDDDDLF